MSDDLTILMPCKDQKDSFLAAAFESVLRQSSPHWHLLVLIDPTTPAAVRDRCASYTDGRIRVIESPRSDLASKLNLGMASAETDYVCTLHSDDELARRSVAILRAYIQRHPSIDFFYSSRRFMDAEGRWLGKILRSTSPVRLSDFATRGSRVKQLLCWRRAKGLEVGGIDERLTVHGCDDFDFPWVMAEAGATFKAVRACLYLIRRHQDFFRLTTHTPIQQQLDVVAAMFRKHRASEPALSRFQRRGLERYILADSTASYRDGKPPQLKLSCYGEITPARIGDFLTKGWQLRQFFPHRVYCIPLEGQEERARAQRLCGVSDPSTLFEIVLFAAPVNPSDAAKERRQAKRVATAQVVIDGARIFCLLCRSDLADLDNGYESWRCLLLNALLGTALEHETKTLWLPSADQALNHTWRELLETERDGDWWRIDVGRNQHRVVMPIKRRQLVDMDDRASVAEFANQEFLFCGL